MNINKEQIKRIYALGAGAGILEANNKDDNLHSLVLSLTGKKSISKLTDLEFLKVQTELVNMMREYKRGKMGHDPSATAVAPPGVREARGQEFGVRGGRQIVAPVAEDDRSDIGTGMMTLEQQRLAWRYIYRLIELDKNKHKATVGERMRGAIKKILGIDVSIKEPFLWVSYENGSKLIEVLKKYVVSAERKLKKVDGGA